MADPDEGHGEFAQGGYYRFPEPQPRECLFPRVGDPARAATILAAAAAWYGATITPRPEHTPGLTDADRTWVRGMLRPADE